MGAKEAWQWLQEQRKPFYIDQLHLTRGWTPVAEKRAMGDSMIAEKTGTAFVPALQKAEPMAQKPSSSTVKAASPESKASEVDAIVTRKDRLGHEPIKRKPLPSKASSSTERTADPDTVVKERSHEASELNGAKKRPTSISSTTSKYTTSAKTDVALVEKTGETSTAVPVKMSAKKTSSATKTKPVSTSKSKKDKATDASKPPELLQLLKPRAEPIGSLSPGGKALDLTQSVADKSITKQVVSKAVIKPQCHSANAMITTKASTVIAA